MISKEELFEDLSSVREISPLVHNITNYVVMNNTANALLSIGASPVMAHALEEAADMASIASSLVINMGTLSPQWVNAMHLAMEAAGKKQTPIVFDPVGVGATPYRNETARELLNEGKPDIIRGNASEILALYSEGSKTKGVDSTHESDSAVDAASFLSEKWNCTVVVSGSVDYIISKDRTLAIENGHAMMAKVTGMGCTASALIGAFAGVQKDHFRACASAMAIMGIAGELAAEKATGPGTMQLHFLDALHTVNQNDINRLFKPAAEHA